MRFISAVTLSVLTSVLGLFAFEARAQMTMSATIIMGRSAGKCISVAGGATNDGAQIALAECDNSPQMQWNLESYHDGFRVIGASTGKCMNVYGNNTANRTAIIQSACAGYDNEIWYLDPDPNGWLLRAKNANRCLTVDGGSSNTGAPLVLYDCGSVDNEIFNFGQGFVSPKQGVRLVNNGSRQCVDVKNNSPAAATNLIQNGCPQSVALGGQSQTWYLKRQNDGYAITVQSTGMCMDVSGGGTNDGQQVIQYPCSGAPNQTWYLQRVAGGFTFISKNSGKCLDASSPTALVQNTCSGASSQNWYATPAGYIGTWGPLINLPLVPVGAAALPNGLFLFWSSWDPATFVGNTGNPQTDTVLFNPADSSMSFATVTNTYHDMFCPGTAFLKDGRLLVNGGSTAGQTSIYDFVSHTWSSGSPMNLGRGYEGDTVLDDGRVFTIGGSWSGGTGGKVGEIYSPSANTWTLLNGIPAETLASNDPGGVYRWDNHAWMYGVGSGRIFQAGPSAQMNWFNTAGNGSYTSAGNRADDQYSMNGNAVMYDVGKILKLGGAPAYQLANASTASYVIDINAGVDVRATGPLAFARSFANSVVLPDGRVFVSGGQAYAFPFTDYQSVLQGEMWSPAANGFQTMAAMGAPRNYHSFALLMRDGRVMVGGGGLCGGCDANHLNIQMYYPDYFFQPNGLPQPRPTIISAPQSTGYGLTMNIGTDSPVTQFAMVRLGSATHSLDNDQRRIPLTIVSQNSKINSYQVTTPANSGVATPGFYMLFALNNIGVPSVGLPVQVL